MDRIIDTRSSLTGTRYTIRLPRIGATVTVDLPDGVTWWDIEDLVIALRSVPVVEEVEDE